MILCAVYQKFILKQKVSKKNEFGQYEEERFRQTLIRKLKDRTLDKVAIAHELCERIRMNDNLNISEDDSAYYLVEAIKHVSKV